MVGIAQVDRNAGIAAWKDSFFLQHACTHIGKLTQFLIGNRIDGLCLWHKMGIGCQNAIHIRPVLIGICLYGPGSQGTADI